MVEVKRVRLGDVAYEYKERIGEEVPDRPVYGVDKSVGLTDEPRYQSSNLSRYKRIEHGMFAYNPMRLNIGSIGFCHDDLAPGIVSPDYVVFGCHEGALLPKFMDYHTQSELWSNWLSLAGEGSVRERIYFRKLETYELALPDVSYQQAAVEILSALDDKIELNRQINHTLEALAQAVFKDWFVDFGPVKRKLAGVIDPCVVLGGLIPDPGVASQIADLFPASIAESALPDGWKRHTLGDFIVVKRGGSPRPIKDFMAEHGLPWLKIADATSEQSPYIFETREFIEPEGLRKTVKLEPGALILSNSATPGLPKFLEIETCIHDGWLYFPEKSSLSDQFLYFYFLNLREFLVSQGNGSIFTNLKTDIVRSQTIALPPDALLKAFQVLAEASLGQILAIAKEGRILAETRDYLLPKLMSGAARVREYEAMAN